MEIQNYIKPELLILVPVLYIIGAMVKSTNIISDKWIPLILGITGVVLAVIYCLTSISLCRECIFSAIIQGILCAGCAVYSNQLFKQIEKKQ